MPADNWDPDLEHGDWWVGLMLILIAITFLFAANYYGTRGRTSHDHYPPTTSTEPHVVLPYR